MATFIERIVEPIIEDPVIDILAEPEKESAVASLTEADARAVKSTEMASPRRPLDSKPPTTGDLTDAPLEEKSCVMLNQAKTAMLIIIDGDADNN